MNTEYIKSLLDKYFEAQTTIEEEKELSNYFNSGSAIDPRFNQVAVLFKVFKAESEIKSQADFVAPTIVRNVEVKKEAKVFTLQRYLKIAAAVLVLALSSFLVVKYTLNNTVEETPKIEVANYIEVTDPDEAMAYTEDALKILAKVFNTSQTGVDAGMKVIDETPVIGSRQ
ncbi:MAG TPA: hypothetical protein PLY70_12090 [Saprospiraceae bacterium]|nr:hypothetical protein [Saprospiraceae bacterium]HPN71393.1 hypothetical protein [Saprospiraceae bacterium]